MAKFKVFKTYKERGEWVEAKFIAEALHRGYKVLKPWGDSQAFDVAVNFGNRIVRVQVKSTTRRVGTGYRCEFEPNRFSAPYTLKQLDFFAAYVIPQDAWYLIPSAELFGRHQQAITLCPIKPRHPERYRYERFREAWALLRRGRCVNCRLMREAEGVEDE